MSCESLPLRAVEQRTREEGERMAGEKGEGVGEEPPTSTLDLSLQSDETIGLETRRGENA